MKMSQKEAVFVALCTVIGVDAFEGACEPTKEQRASVNNILFESFRAGKIEYKGDMGTDAELKSYVSGLQSNWLRKDKRLNGNVKYQAKNPGSRAGSADPGIKAMRTLLEAQTDATKREEIQRYIDKRLAELKPAKVTEINVDALPEALRGYVTQS